MRAGNLISVIIPVYNAQPYLHRCIDSVLASAYSDFEIILVNDGSTDCSPEICRAYAEADSRVIYIPRKPGRVLRQEPGAGGSPGRMDHLPGFGRLHHR
nr:glycosyltransferase family 2 protein [uncultured Acetatifactor sp.]